MTILAEMYISLLPVILAGVMNMVWVKLPYMRVLCKPIDQNKDFIDGKPIFGGNKTWKGFLGMIVGAILMTVLWGALCGKVPYLDSHNYLYRNYENSLLYNIFIGFFLGFAYVLLELPNSFLKRRLNIVPGKTLKGKLGIVFVVLDQADSIFGCVLIISIVNPMSVAFYAFYVTVGALTHILINVLLYLAKLRKNMF